MCFQCVVVPTTRNLEVEHMALLSEGDVGRGIMVLDQYHENP